MITRFVRTGGLSVVAGLLAALGGLTPTASGEPPNGIPAPAAPRPQPDHIDRAVLAAWTRAARPVDPAVLARIPPPPTTLDYSPDVTFMRCQHPWGGCVGHSYCHAVDLIKEWEHPYTPDVSFPCLWWHNGMALEQVKPGHVPPDLSTLAFTKGMCSEARYRTAYDRYTPVTTADGKDILYWKPGPDAAALAESQVYHAKYGPPIAVQPAAGDGLSPTVADLKKLLLRYGPVVAWGNGHCNTVVGYDDAAGRFKVLDNYGDWNFTAGYTFVAYKNLHTEKQGLQYFENTPTPRAGTPYAYSARVRVRHSWRGSLTLRIGVGSEPPMVVWETHGRTHDGQHELSRNLDLDVPLPEYAAKHWPPGPGNRWYLRVEDNDRDGLVGHVAEFTLARLYTSPRNHSVGAFQTETFGGPCQVAIPDPVSGDHVVSTGTADMPPPNPHPGVATVYVPDTVSPNTAKPVAGLAHEIRLDPAGCAYRPDHTVTLAGVLTAVVPVRVPSTPGPGRPVGLYALVDHPCVNKPDTWQRLATVQTDAAGRFAGSVKLANPGTVRAVAAAITGASGAVEASSQPMAIGPPSLTGSPTLVAVASTKPWQKFAELADTGPRPMPGPAR